VRVEVLILNGLKIRLKSNMWNQIKADLTEIKIFLSENKESASNVNAILAAVELGYYNSVKDSVNNVVKLR
jgi:sugar (pentulose or hexulose) kinase